MKLVKSGVHNEFESSQFDKSKYQSVIGSVMYAMGTRPDISFVVSKLSQFSSNPREQHWLAMKRLLRYLVKTKDYALIYQGNYKKELTEPELVGYSDADYGN